ncbi:MAG: class I SAM-dependent methyltransferase [Bacteroidota bacterium]
MQNFDSLTPVCTYCQSVDSIWFCNTQDIFDTKYELRHCVGCKAYFLWPFPSDELLRRAYDTSYYGATQQKFSFAVVEKAVDWFRKKRARKIVKLLPDGASVLDIGCGNGDFLHYVSQCGHFELFGIERDEMAAKRAATKANIHLQTTPLNEGDFAANAFDVITLFHVFEHLTEPEKTLNIINKILKPEGTFVLSFPNIASWQARVFKGKWLHLDPPRHLFFMAPKDFKAIMRNKNFECVGTTYFSMEQNPFGLVQSLLNVVCKKREVLFERLKGNTQYAAEYGSWNVFLQKCFFVLHFPLFVLTDLIAACFKKSATVKFTFKNTKPC